MYIYKYIYIYIYIYKHIYIKINEENNLIFCIFWKSMVMMKYFPLGGSEIKCVEKQRKLFHLFPLFVMILITYCSLEVSIICLFRAS